MSTATAPRVRETTNPPKLSFAGILNSEWIKLRSVRSTVWVFSITLVAAIGLALLVASVASAIIGESPGMTGAGAAAVVGMSTTGLALGQLAIAVLGVLIITGEYSTGLIKASLISVPTRLPMLAAKAIVLAGTTFVLGLVITFVSFLISAPLLANAGLKASLADEGVVLALVGGALSLVFIALISLGIGTMVRSSAAGIAIALGLFLLLPTVVGIVLVFVQAEWAIEAARYLPTTVAQSLYAIPTETDLSELGLGKQFEFWQAALILTGWSALTLGGGAALLARRDA